MGKKDDKNEKIFDKTGEFGKCLEAVDDKGIITVEYIHGLVIKYKINDLGKREVVK